MMVVVVARGEDEAAGDVGKGLGTWSVQWVPPSNLFITKRIIKKAANLFPHSTLSPCANGLSGGLILIDKC